MAQEAQMHDVFNLTGSLLVASPLVYSESYFYKSVIYIIQHTNQGVVGVVVNHPAVRLGKTLYVVNEEYRDEKALNLDNIDTYIGGPIDGERGIILHSDDNVSSNKIDLSSDIKVLHDITQGNGPKLSMLTLGYCSWANGQLEEEIKDNFWLISPVDKQLVFEIDNQDKWDVALNKLNINLHSMSYITGNC